MVKDDTLILSLAAFCHDLGKLVQDCFKIEQSYLESNQSLYQPVYNGQYKYRHALWTAAFIDLHKNLFPKMLFDREWGEDNFLNLAAMHHKPESPKQWVISVADRLSSGQDRDVFLEGKGIAIKDFKSTRLVPILEQLSPQQKKVFESLNDFEWEYELAPMSATNIFPIKREKKDKNSYKSLYENFHNALSGLAHKNESLLLWMQHFESIWKKYTFFVPAARVGKVIPDVSLYHHSKTSAALATAIYLYHVTTDSLIEKDIKADGEKFLVIAGDFFGIQKFIFSRAGEEVHHRSKILRGRSFAVSLFCELAADLLCQEIGLSPYSVLLNSAGKFYILAPNLDEVVEKIYEIEEKINNWLIKMTYGEASLGISFTKGRASSFEKNNFKDFWQEVQSNLQQKKVSRFSPVKYCGVFDKYLDSFSNDLDSPICPLCGKRPSSVIVENDELIYKQKKGSACAFCRDHIMLGTNLVKNDKIAVLYKVEENRLQNKNKYLKEPIFGEYQIAFVQGKMNEFAKEGVLRKLWQVNVTETGEIPEEITFMPLNGYVPVYTKEDEYDDRLILGKKSEKTSEDLIDAIKEKSPKTLAHLALSSLEKGEEDKWFGVDALGVLKADVDDLALLFACGLPKERFTISRLYALSSQFNNFFAFYLPYVLRSSRDFNSIYTVFAGGDDLFLLGPWDKIIDFADFIYDKFNHYVCENKEVHFSAGISFVRANMPVDIFAQYVEENLELAKDKGKNRVNLFHRVVEWEEFKNLYSIKDELYHLLSTYLTKSTLYKLNELIEMSEKEKNILQRDKIDIKHIHNFKWRALLNYILSRNIQSKDKDIVEKMIARFVQFLEKYRGDMVIPLWTVLYKQRKYN